MAQDSKERRYEVPLDGKLITGDDPAKIGPNFQSLVNLRYSNKHPKAIGGMSKINTSAIDATYLKARSGIHYRKAQPVETHLLVESYNTGLTASTILQNTTTVPTAGNFSATSLYTPASGADNMRWSYAPNGDIACCNGEEVCLWGGDEMEIGGFINYLNEVADPLIGEEQTFSAVPSTDLISTLALVRQTGGPVVVAPVGVGDVLPAGLSEGVIYYVHRYSDISYSLHLTYYDAVYAANLVDITDEGTGSFTIDPISGDPTVYTQTIYDYTNELRNTATDSENIATMYKDTDNALYFYIGSVRPCSGFKLYVSVANTSASTMAVDYWDGTAWTGATNIVDGTSASSISLAQTGSVSFDATTTLAKLKYIKGIYIYWYRVTISAISDGIKLYYATINSPFQQIKDIWSGDNFEIDSFKIFGGEGYLEATVQVRENKFDINDGGTFVQVGGTDTSDFLACGFQERMTGCAFSFYSGSLNDNGSTIIVSYWNGADWATVGIVDDGTLYSSKTFAQTGTITWDAVSPELEFKRNFENGPMLYYYRFTFTATLSSDVKIYWVTGIPAQKKLNAYSFPLLSNNRLFLCCDTQYKKNSVICSAVETSSVFNGEDSQEHFFGDDSELTGGAWLYSQFGSSLFNLTLFFKANETWALVGTGPEDWVKYRVSSVVGCQDPETIRVVDLGIESAKDTNRNIAIWRSSNAIVMSDGRTPIEISADIKDVFDKRSSTYINNAVASKSFWDSDNREYHWLYADGTNTTLNKEKVFSFAKMGWFDIDRTSTNNLQLGIEVQDTYGSNYVYGFINTGYAERLEYGNNFDGSNIELTMQFGDIAIHGGNMSLETTPQYSGLVCTAKTNTNNITVSHYGDGSTTANETWVVPSTSSGKRLMIDVEHKTLGRYIFHSWKFVVQNSSEVVGFEPLYFYVLYDVVGDHTRDRG